MYIRTSDGVAIILAIIAMLAIMNIIGWGFFTIIPAGHTGVTYSWFGGVQDSQLSEGFHLKFPWERITPYSIRTQEYTMSSIIGEGAESQSDSISALTNEGLMVELDLTVYYRLDSSGASKLHKTVGPGYTEILIRPQSREAIRNVVAGYKAQEVYNTDTRQKISVEIQEQLSDRLSERPVIIERVALRNVRLPEKIQNAIDTKQEAEQEAIKMKFVLDKEKQEAERKRIEAEGIRDSQKTIDESLTQEYLTWYWIQSLKEHESVMYVPIGDTGMPLMKNVDAFNMTG